MAVPAVNWEVLRPGFNIAAENFSLASAPEPRPGNDLPISGLVFPCLLQLYHTPITINLDLEPGSQPGFIPSHA